MNWPKQVDCDAFYGNPRGRNGQASPTWESQNLTRIKPPYQMTYAGKPITSFLIHKKCADAMMTALEAINKETSGDKKLLADSGASIFGGCYNFRLMRSGSTMLSMHSYGCAIDLDPGRNAFHDVTPNFLNYPFIIKAFEDLGAEWGGRWAGRGCDGMHFQFAHVR